MLKIGRIFLTSLISFLTVMIIAIIYSMHDPFYVLTMGLFVILLPLFIAIMVFDKILIFLIKKAKTFENIFIQLAFGTSLTLIYVILSAYIEKLYYYEWDFTQVHINISTSDIIPLCGIALFSILTISVYHILVFRFLFKK
jgi:hypothetical protein